MKYFKVTLDGTYTGIEKIEIKDASPEDMERYFNDCYKTLSEAKKVALEQMIYIRNEYSYAIAQMKKLSTKDFN